MIRISEVSGRNFEIQFPNGMRVFVDLESDTAVSDSVMVEVCNSTGQPVEIDSQPFIRRAKALDLLSILNAAAAALPAWTSLSIGP